MYKYQTVDFKWFVKNELIYTYLSRKEMMRWHVSLFYHEKEIAAYDEEQSVKALRQLEKNETKAVGS